MTARSPPHGSASATTEPAASTGTSLSASAAASGSGEAGIAPAAEKRGFVVVDVARCSSGGAGFGESEWEKVCRICQLSTATGEEGSELMLLGCGCKGELSVAHRQCAEAWFKVKGNRYCEICGANAKNVTAAVESMLPEEVYVRREANNRNSYVDSENIVWWRRLPFCNLLMACLIIAFILLWFFRGIWNRCCLKVSFSVLPPFASSGSVYHQHLILYISSVLLFEPKLFSAFQE